MSITERKQRFERYEEPAAVNSGLSGDGNTEATVYGPSFSREEQALSISGPPSTLSGGQL